MFIIYVYKSLAVEGDIGSRHAEIKLLPPLLGKHYYPHGVEYGDGETFPTNVIPKANNSYKISKRVKRIPNQ